MPDLRITEWFPGKGADYDDLAPTRREAQADERATRRRKPIPREPAEPTPLLDALERATATAQRLHREAYVEGTYAQRNTGEACWSCAGLMTHEAGPRCIYPDSHREAYS